MSNRKHICRLGLLLSAVTAGLLLYYIACYVLVDFRSYPRRAETLDLTDREISIAHFDKLRQKLPDCDISWNVPLSGGAQAHDATQITVSSLTDGDVAALAYFPNLQEVDALECRDYGPLLLLLDTYPDLRVQYTVALGDDLFSPDVREIEVCNVTMEELPRLNALPRLKTLICTGGEVLDAQALQKYCQSAGITFCLRAGDQVIPMDARSVTAGNVTADQFPLFGLLPKLKTLTLTDPQTAPEELFWLEERLEKVDVTWEMALCGVLCSSQDRELNVSGGDISLDELRTGIAYFPEAQSLYLGQCEVDNETLADFREELRGTIKVVWQVTMGNKLTACTDDTSFMPLREGIYYFNDEEAYNLRYCEDMVAIDIGHMSIHNIEFVEFMPNLTYLILAHTQVSDITPISTCKNLKFLELDWAPLRDLSALVGCTGLEDLNLGMTYASFEPIKEMTWLNNLWVIDCNDGVAYQMTQALPNTKVQGSGSATVASGWRKLPNYYAMRDALGMYYMSWD